MKKIILLIITGIVAGAFMLSCSEDKPDRNNSIFVDPTEEPSSFDRWLDENYVNYYNIRFMYRLRDVETDFGYNIVPADLQKSKEMAIVLKHLWLEAYEEVAEDHANFIRSTCPKLFHLVGSAEHDPEDGTIRLGVAEGGMKITITEVNNLNPANIRNQNYFHTVHHEFGHILNQTIDYDQDFNLISAVDYAPSTWFNRSTAEANQLGFVTNYAGKSPGEDFVEILSLYVTLPRAQWNQILQTAGTEGRAKIEQKLEIIKNYMQGTWGVNMDTLYDVCQRRADEVAAMDFSNLGF